MSQPAILTGPEDGVVGFTGIFTGLTLMTITYRLQPLDAWFGEPGRFLLHLEGDLQKNPPGTFLFPLYLLCL